MFKRKRLSSQVSVRDRVSRRHKTLTIGVAGTKNGAGVSHLVFTLATYFNKNKEKVAIIEKSDIPVFDKVEKAYEGLGFKGETREFQMGKRRFYKAYTQDFNLLRDDGFDIIIIDYGLLSIKDRQAYCQCDIKFVIGSGNDWSIDGFQSYISFDDKGSFKYLINFASGEELSLFTAIYGKKGKAVPFIKDPFLWNKKLHEFAENIMFK